jgi:LacI family transcriptional regulator
MAGKRVGIRDVAAAAGVSTTTVSDALNGVKGARVGAETRAKIQAAADLLGYSPSRLARGLRARRSGTLGLLSDHIATTPHAGKIILGAQERGLESGFTLLLFNTGGNPVVELRDIQTLLEHQVEGILYASMYHREVQLPRAFDAIPTVLVDATSPRSGKPSVVPDEVGGAAAAIGELLRHGHRRIGFATNRDDIPATRGRLRGYRETLAAAGVRFDRRLVVAAESESGGGYEAALELLRLPNRPTALFCFNDRMALGAYRAAGELGLRIPDDVSVVGFDNQEIIAEGIFPALTTVALPHYAMGSWAVERLLRLIEEPGHADAAGRPQLMPCPLIVRESVARPQGRR